MKRVQNWRDYLDDQNYTHKQKFIKKKKNNREEDDVNGGKTKHKRK